MGNWGFTGGIALLAIANSFPGIQQVFGLRRFYAFAANFQQTPEKPRGKFQRPLSTQSSLSAFYKADVFRAKGRRAYAASRLNAGLGMPTAIDSLPAGRADSGWPSALVFEDVRPHTV